MRLIKYVLGQVEKVAYLGMLLFHSTLKTENEKDLLVTVDQ